MSVFPGTVSSLHPMLPEHGHTRLAELQCLEDLAQFAQFLKEFQHCIAIVACIEGTWRDRIQTTPLKDIQQCVENILDASPTPVSSLTHESIAFLADLLPLKSIAFLVDLLLRYGLDTLPSSLSDGLRA